MSIFVGLAMRFIVVTVTGYWMCEVNCNFHFVLALNRFPRNRFARAVIAFAVVYVIVCFATIAKFFLSITKRLICLFAKSV